MELIFRGIETSEHEEFRAGALDANGRTPILDAGSGLGPCRHCLDIMGLDEVKLILGYRPFATRHPYSEVGPIFLHPTECKRYEEGRPPGWFDHLEPAIIRGYGRDDWIRYDTGKAIPGSDVERVSKTILADTEISYVHVRSRFGCLQCRVDRA